MFKRKLKTITVCLPMNDNELIREFINTRIKNLGRSSIYIDKGNRAWFSHKSLLNVTDTAMLYKRDFPDNVVKIVGDTIIVNPSRK